MTAHIGDRQSEMFDLGPEFGQHVSSREPLAFRHELPNRPEFALESVAQLADTLGAKSVIREDAERPLVFADGAPEPPHLANAGDVIRALEESGSWMTLLNIEQVPAYRDFVELAFDGIADRALMRRSALRRRMGFVFASSPNSVTGAHFDVEHSLLLQLRGNRVLSFGTFPDADTRDREIRRYWNGSYGKLTTMPVHARDVPIGPGDGVYIPPFVPHWLHNGPASSLSLTITFFTRDSDRETLVQVCNERLRKLGISPRRAGESAVRDQLKVTLMRGYGLVRRGGG